MLTIKQEQYVPQKVSLALGAFLIGMVGTIGILHAIDPRDQPRSLTTEARILGERHSKEDAVDSLPETSKEATAANENTISPTGTAASHDSTATTESYSDTKPSSKNEELATEPEHGASADNSDAQAEPAQIELIPAPSLELLTELKL
jgi:hypothetical protein